MRLEKQDVFVQSNEDDFSHTCMDEPISEMIYVKKVNDVYVSTEDELSEFGIKCMAAIKGGDSAQLLLIDGSYENDKAKKFIVSLINKKQ